MNIYNTFEVRLYLPHDYNKFWGENTTVGAIAFAIQALLVGFLALGLSFNKTASVWVGGVAAALGGISLIFGAFAEWAKIPLYAYYNI